MIREAHRVLFLPLIDLREPRVLTLGLDKEVQLAQRHLRVGHDAYVRNNVLADLGGVDIDVHEMLDARRERVEPGGDPVVAAHADHDQHVRLAHRFVGVSRAHESDHLQGHGVGHRECAGAEQRPADRDVRLVRKLRKLLLGAGDEHAATGEDHRSLRALDEVGDLAQLGGIRPRRRRVGPPPHRLCPGS